MRGKSTETCGRREPGRASGAARGVAFILAAALIAGSAASSVGAGSGSTIGQAAPGAAGGAATGRWNRPARGFSSEVPVAWYTLLYDLIRAEKLSPPVASRRIGYTGVALYEALVPGMPDHRSLAGQLNELRPLPGPGAARAFHWPTVANSALASVLRQLFAGASADSLGKIDALDSQLAGRFQPGLPPPLFAASVARGQSVADAVIAWASGDGFSTVNNCSYTPSGEPGQWEPTPPAFAQALLPCWGQLRPFVLESTDQCAPPGPPVYSTDPTSEFYAQGFEVFDTVNHLTPEQSDIAQFWADNPGATGTPPGHWISIVSQIAQADGLTLDVAAEAYARVGIAVADAFISCWATKYVYNLLRPITYIRNVFDPAWTPLLVTPAFPEYTSGHSVQSGAAATVLTDQLGDLAFTDNTHASRGLPPRSFTSFTQAAQEAAISRLYAGIHYRAAIEDGVAQGECIGRVIHDSVRFLREEDEGDQAR